MLKDKEPTTLEQQKDTLIADFQKNNPERFETYKTITMLYKPQSSPIEVKTSVREDSTNG
jgi:hypothetical protein